MRITNQRKATKTKKFHKKVILKWIILLVLLGIALYFYRNSLQEILQGIQALSARQLLVSCLIATVFFLTEGYIVYYMAHPIEATYSWTKGIRVAYLCEFYRILTLGSGSGFAAIYYLQKDGVAYAKGTGITMIQFVFKKIAVMLLGVTGFIYLLEQPLTGEVLGGYREAMVTGCVITMLIAVCMTVITLSEKVKDWLLAAIDWAQKKYPEYNVQMQKWRENLILLNDTGRDLLTHKKRFLMLLVLNLFKLAVIDTIPAYILYGMGQLTIMQSTMLMAVAYMLAGVIPAPSGIGSLEFVFLLFFNCFAQENNTVPSILVFRFATWIVPFVIGAIVYTADKLVHVRQTK